MQNQPISAAQAAEALRSIPGLARVEFHPSWSDGSGRVVRRQYVTFYDVAGNYMPIAEACWAVLDVATDADLQRPQTYDVASGVLSPTYPAGGYPVPLWSSPLAADPYLAAQLEAQRHELEDDAEPPRAVADPASDFARSVADGFVSLPDWGDDPAPDRETVDVPVQGDAL